MYEPKTKQAQELAEVLVKAGWFQKVEFDIRKAESMTTTEYVPVKAMEVSVGYKVRPIESFNTENRYLKNGYSVETNFESIAKEFIGVCEDKKEWVKDLKAAVGEYGHDELLTAFYEWASSQTSGFIRKPVKLFLKDVGAKVAAVSKPAVSNPSLDAAEKQIAIVSDNRVFFGGSYRLTLALLIKEHGVNMVVRAFSDFYQTLEEKDIKWAAREFLQRASVMINTIKEQEAQIKLAEKQVQQSYEQAKNSIEDIEEEEEL